MASKRLRAVFLLAALGLNCGFLREEAGRVSVVLSPDFFQEDATDYTLAARILVPGRPVGLRTVNLASGMRFIIDPTRDYIAEPLRLKFSPNPLGGEATVIHLTLFGNSSQEIEQVFSFIGTGACSQAAEGDRDACFLHADSRTLHDDPKLEDDPSLESLNPVAFATILIEPGQKKIQKIALLPYDIDGDRERDIDLDRDTLPDPADLDGECSFQSSGRGVKGLQCATLSLLQALDDDTAFECDDENAKQNALEVDECLDEIDQDCDGVLRESCAPIDVDGDGACASAPPPDLPADDPTLLILCSQGFDDCNDFNAEVFPGAILDDAVCSAPGAHGGFDVDCDGQDDFCDCDADTDAFCPPDDCDDGDSAINPGANEVCGNALDEDCTGGASPCEPPDADGDGHCRATAAFYDQSPPPQGQGFPEPEPNLERALVAGCLSFNDCNDADNNRFPGNTELCGDNRDNNCAGGADEGCDPADADGDGFTPPADCDDSNPFINPNGTEICGNQEDENCAGGPAASCTLDNDGDRAEDAGDCNTNDPEVFPGNVEVCDGKDNDCDTLIDEGNPPIPGVAGNIALNNAQGNPLSCALDPADNPDFEDGIENNLACQEGFSVCSAGVAICVGAIPPKVEICSGLPVDTAGTIIGDRFFPVDDDCDGVFATGEVDADPNGGDGALACDEVRTSESDPDCEPNDSEVYPVISLVGVTLADPTPFCDGKPDDCVFLAAEEADADGDGFALCSVDRPANELAPGFQGDDCDDTDPAIRPDAIELCDGIDSNCNGATEECQDGNNQSGDGCSSACVDEFCGDGVDNDGANEECDDGDANDNDFCRNDCSLNVCGDGAVFTGTEECDDGNNTNGDGCNAQCIVEFCGDGIDNNGANEECDDGNNTNGDGCSAICEIEPLSVCGNGIVEAPEQCDDGNMTNGDGCEVDCTLTP